MKQPLQLRFIGMEASPALEAAARQKAEKLDQFRPDRILARAELGERGRGDQGEEKGEPAEHRGSATSLAPSCKGVQARRTRTNSV